MTLLDTTGERSLQPQAWERSRHPAAPLPRRRADPCDPDTTVRVGFVGDSGLVRNGLKALLERAVLGTAQLVDPERSAPEDVDVVLVDLHACGSRAAEQIQRLVALGYGPVLACGWEPATTEPERFGQVGATGYLSWQLSGADLIAALTRLSAGSPDAPPHGLSTDVQVGLDLAGCSAREVEILTLICRGLSNKEIADQLFLSINTVKTYIRSAYRTIGVARRPQAVIWGIQHGCLSTPAATPPPQRLPTHARVLRAG